MAPKGRSGVSTKGTTSGGRWRRPRAEPGFCSIQTASDRTRPSGHRAIRTTHPGSGATGLDVDTVGLPLTIFSTGSYAHAGDYVYHPLDNSFTLDVEGR